MRIIRNLKRHGLHRSVIGKSDQTGGQRLLIPSSSQVLSSLTAQQLFVVIQMPLDYETSACCPVLLLLEIIRRRQKNWIGHILRGDSLQREIMEGRMEGKRKAWTKAHGLDDGRWIQ